MEKLLEYLQTTYTSTDGSAKWGAVGVTGAAALIGSAIAFFSGGGVTGILLGVLLGAIGGTAFNEPINKGLQNIINIRPSVKTPKITPTPQEDVSVTTVTMVNQGKQYEVEFPDPATLRKPWQNPNAYIDKLHEDTLNLIGDSVRTRQSRDILETTIRNRNQDYYDYAATIEKYASREAPPSFPKLNLTPLPDLLQQETKVSLRITDNEWNGLSPVAKLAHIDRSVDKQLVTLYQGFADLRNTGEELKRESPSLTRANILANMGDNIKEYVPFVDSRNERQESSIKKYLAGGDEKSFSNEMEAVALEEAVNGPERSNFVRNQASLVIERRRLFQQKEEIKDIKKNWATQFDAWLSNANDFAKNADNVRHSELLADVPLTAQSFPVTLAQDGSKSPATTPPKSKGDTGNKHINPPGA